MKTSRVLFVGILLTPIVIQFVANSQSNRFAASPQGDTSPSFEAATTRQLSDAFTFEVLATTSEAPLALRFFSTAVKTDSRGRIITGPTNDPVKNIVGPESAGMRAGLARFTKIMFGAGYIDGRPDPGTRIRSQQPPGDERKSDVAKSPAAIPKSSARVVDHARRQKAVCGAPRTRRLSRLARRRCRHCTTTRSALDRLAAGMARHAACVRSV